MNDEVDQATKVVIESIKTRAAKLAHVLDMQGLAALLARVLYDESILVSMVDKSGFPMFSEDQIYAIIVSGLPHVEHVELGSSSLSISEGTAGPSGP